MEIFEYLSKIIEFHLERRLPYNVYLYDKAQCERIREFIKGEKGVTLPENTEKPLVDRIDYGGFTFFLADCA